MYKVFPKKTSALTFRASSIAQRNRCGTTTMLFNLYMSLCNGNNRMTNGEKFFPGQRGKRRELHFPLPSSAQYRFMPIRSGGSIYLSCTARPRLSKFSRRRAKGKREYIGVTTPELRSRFHSVAENLWYWISHEIKENKESPGSCFWHTLCRERARRRRYHQVGERPGWGEVCADWSRWKEMLHASAYIGTIGVSPGESVV